jgi:hypothetical protein
VAISTPDRAHDNGVLTPKNNAIMTHHSIDKQIFVRRRIFVSLPCLGNALRTLAFISS